MGTFRRSLTAGGVVGLGAYVVCYATVYILAVVDGYDPISIPRWKGVGTILYNAQFVDGRTTMLGQTSSLNLVRDPVFGGHITSTVPAVVYHLVPVIVLVAGGLVLGVRGARREPPRARTQATRRRGGDGRSGGRAGAHPAGGEGARPRSQASTRGAQHELGREQATARAGPGPGGAENDARIRERTAQDDHRTDGPQSGDDRAVARSPTQSRATSTISSRHDATQQSPNLSSRTRSRAASGSDDRNHDRDRDRSGALRPAAAAAAGAAVLVGYLVLSIVGVFLFDAAGTGPKFWPAQFAAIGYPLICGALGGALSRPITTRA